MSNADPQTTALPPGFRLLNDGPGRWLCVNDNSLEEHVSVWDTPERAGSAAWDWWHDVKDKPRGK